MRIQPAPPAALGRQLAEWRQPLDSGPEVEAAIMRMLSVIDGIQRQRDFQERQARSLS